MSILGTSEAMEYVRCIAVTKKDVKALLESSPEMANYFDDRFYCLFEFELHCFLTHVTDVLCFRHPELRHALIPGCYRSIMDSAYAKEYLPTSGIDVEDIINDRMDRYGMIVRGEWQPPAYWYLGSSKLPDDTLMQQLALLGDYIHHSYILGEVPIGDEINVCPIGSIFDPIKPIMPLLLYETILSRVSKYATTMRDWLNPQPPKKKKLFGLFG